MALFLRHLWTESSSPLPRYSNPQMAQHVFCLQCDSCLQESENRWCLCPAVFLLLWSPRAQRQGWGLWFCLPLLVTMMIFPPIRTTSQPGSLFSWCAFCKQYTKTTWLAANILKLIMTLFASYSFGKVSCTVSYLGILLFNVWSVVSLNSFACQHLS